MNYGFYISGRSGRLTKYLQQVSKEVASELKIVFSDSMIEDNLKQLIQRKNIGFIEYDYKSIAGESRAEKNRNMSDLLFNALKANNIDYCISFGSHILSGDLLDAYKYRIINFHPAILPLFPGLKAIDQAVDHGNVHLLGNTAHFIDSGVDTGLIIMQSITTMQNFIEKRDYDVVLDMQIPMLNKIIKAIDNGDLRINEGHVQIKNANYGTSHCYPEYEQ